MTTATAPPRPSGFPPRCPWGDAASMSDVQSALDALVAANLARIERDELRYLISVAARVQGWLDSFDVGCARRARELADDGVAESAESLFSAAGKRSSEEASRIKVRADALDEFGGPTAGSSSDPTSAHGAPGDETGAGDAEADSFERALRDGRISAGHVDAIGHATRRLDVDARAEFHRHLEPLRAAALVERVEVFARRCRALAQRIVAAQATSDADELDRQRKNSTVKRWVDKITGMHHTSLELDPIRDAQLWSIVNAHLTSMVQADGNAKTPWMEMQVDAFLAAATGAFTPDPDPDSPNGAGARADALAHERRVPEIGVLLDYGTLVNGLHDHSICETDDGVPLPVSTVRRLCCDAEIIPIMLGGDGVPLDMGRSVRTANRRQRWALRAVYRTCAHPDCTMPFSACKAHHVRWWWRDLGPTDLDNLIPLCERHHHLVHEGGWRLTMTPDRVTTWTRPDGVVAHHGRTTDRAPGPHRSPTSKPAPSAGSHSGHARTSV